MCKRYELQDDGRTWLPKVTAENSGETTVEGVESHITTESTQPETAGITLDEHDDDSTRYPVVQMPFRKRFTPFAFICRPGDILLFPPGEIHHYGRHPDAREWYHQWVYFRPRAYWQEWLSWPSMFAHTGFYRPDEVHQHQFRELFAQIIEAGQAGGRYAELLAINLLEQLLLRRMEAINESLNPPLDHRVRDACQYISDHLADSQFDIASVAQHVCLSPSRLSHLFRQQLGVSVLSWREDQRISQAKLLLSTAMLWREKELFGWVMPGSDKHSVTRTTLGDLRRKRA
jgi:AraC-like DNA-binding protein